MSFNWTLRIHNSCRDWAKKLSLADICAFDLINMYNNSRSSNVRGHKWGKIIEITFFHRFIKVAVMQVAVM